MYIVATLPQKPQFEQVVGDLAFILDASNSGEYAFKRMKDFVKYLLDDFGLSTDGSHAAVITYDKEPVLNIKLNQFTDYAAFRNQLDEIAYVDGGPRVDMALSLAKDEAFTVENGGRLEVKNLLILITDGLGSQGGVVDIATELQNKGIDLLVIGVGQEVDVDILDKIAGKNAPAPIVKTFDELATKKFVGEMYQAGGDIGRYLYPGLTASIFILCFLRLL